MDQSVEEVNEQGSYQPPNSHDVNWRCRSRSPENSSPRKRHRYDVTDTDTDMMVILTDQMVAIVIN